MQPSAVDAQVRCTELLRAVPPLDVPQQHERSWSIQESLQQHRGLTRQHELLDDIAGRRASLRKAQVLFCQLEVKEALAAAHGSGNLGVAERKQCLNRLQSAMTRLKEYARLQEIDDLRTTEHRAKCESEIDRSNEELRRLKESVEDIQKNPLGDDPEPGNRKIFYCCNCKVGGHGARYCSYLLQRPNWRVYPNEKWFVDKDRGQCHCPLGAKKVDFTDETHFSRVSMHIKGRGVLEDKRRLWVLVPELMPETFVIDNKKWIGEIPKDEDYKELSPWFVKETDRNWGTSVRCCQYASECMDLAQEGAVYVVQRHIPKPLLYDGELREQEGPDGVVSRRGPKEMVKGRKCHIKFYNLLIGEGDGRTWRVYTYGDGYLCISPNEWSPTDLSKETQITIIRSQRIGDWPVWPKIYKECQSKVATCIQRAVEQEELQGRDKKQFEIISADFVMDEDYKCYMLEFNTGPVLRDRKDSPTVHDEGMINGALHLLEPWEGGDQDKWDLALTVVGPPMKPEPKKG